MKKFFLLAALLPFFSLAQADFELIQKQVTEKLGMQVFSVANAPLESPELLQVSTERGLLYMSEDLRYLFFGKIYDVDKGFSDLTESALTEIRSERLKSVKGTTIDFVAEQQKYQVYVFTDTSCGYCRKLHHEISTYLDQGITVHYLAFPRGGRRSPAFNIMRNVWCAAEPNQAMTKAKNQQAVSDKICNSPVDSHYALGAEFAVTGTPAIVLPSGQLIPGYVPAERLLASLEGRG